jgi:Flp pilus assembly pilin Flp
MGTATDTLLVQERLMSAKFMRLARNEDGATAIEYGLIAIAAISAFQRVGSNLSTVFHNVGVQL